MEKCIICNGLTKVAIQVPDIYKSGFVNYGFDYNKIAKSSLSLNKCVDCGFIQLDNFLNQDELYREYYYRSSVNNTMVECLQDIVDSAELLCPDATNLLDIGCNDGTLLSLYKNKQKAFYKVGCDPATNLKTKHCDIFHNTYFDSTLKLDRKFDIITSIAMFYDVLKPRDFVGAIRDALANDGIWVMQMTDLTCMMQINAYDNICHEHIGYYTLKNFCQLCKDCGLEVFKVEYNNTNGRSVRCYVKKEQSTRKVTISVKDSLESEEIFFLMNPVEKYEKQIFQSLQDLNHYIVNSKKFIYCLGASTKGNTLLQLLSTDACNRIISCGEVDKEKINRYTIGTNIPILPEDKVFKEKSPESTEIIILPWHYKEFFRKKFDWWLEAGGTFIIPCPVPYQITK